MKTGTVKVHRFLIDNESSISLLYKSAFVRIKLSEKDLLPCANALQGFFGELKDSLEVITLPIELGVVPQKVIR